MPVEYRFLFGFDGYRFGNDGSIWSEWNIIKTTHRGSKRVRTGRWKRLSPTLSSDGIMRVRLKKSANVRGGTNAARLILAAFTNENHTDKIVRFLNGNHRDMRVDNMRWGDMAEAANPLKGEAHPCWSGDKVSKNGGRCRARKLYAIGECQRCGKPATDRHHIDDNQSNNKPSNILICCRRCHMQVDGRAERLAAWSPVHNQPQPPKECTQCGKLYKPMRKGLCGACYDRKRKRNANRKRATASGV